MRVWFDGVPQFPSNNKANLGTTGGTGQGPLGIWWYDSANSRLYLYSTINPASTFSSLESLVYGVGSCRNAAICGLSASNIYLDFVNPVIQGGAVAGFRSSGGSYIRIYGTTTDRNNCQFSDVARGIAFTDSDGIGTGSVGVGNQVYNCTFNQSIPVSHSAYCGNKTWLGGSMDKWCDEFRHLQQYIYQLAHTAVEIRNAGTTSVQECVRAARSL